MPKIVGQAVANQRAYYPLESGHCRIVEPGETFDLVEGHTDGNWFTRSGDQGTIQDPEPAPKRKKGAKQEPAPEPAPEPETPATGDPLA